VPVDEGLEQISVAEAPSVNGEELPAVTEPPALKAVLRPASFAASVSRGQPSAVTSPTGAISAASLPSARAASAFFWLSSE
jgi:hypothetical protein